MEGYKYVSQPPAAGGGRPRGPVADFENTAESQLGVIPRAVNALFAALKRESSTRRCVVR